MIVFDFFIILYNLSMQALHQKWMTDRNEWMNGWMNEWMNDFEFLATGIFKFKGSYLVVPSPRIY